MKPYRPQRKQKEILARAWEHIESVPYQVSLRWLFYCLLQDGIYKDKDDYHNKFKGLLRRARKRFYEEWRPWTLVDDTRSVHRDWHGYLSIDDWKSEIYRLGCELDPWPEQGRYGIIAFEAEAMFRQFEYYAPSSFSLWPFRGDPGIEYKHRLAMHISKAAEIYQCPVTLFYFGDLDQKGEEIPKSALADIRAWCKVSFQFVRGGLNAGDEVRFNLRENFEKPGQYQWEALTDEGARALIAEALGDFYDQDAGDVIIEREDEATQMLRDALDRL